MSLIAITGAARGIAFELAKAHHAAGDRVLAFCRDSASAENLVSLAAGSDGSVAVHEMDVASDESVRAAAATVPQGGTVDILYNVAGILGSLAPELETGSSDWSLWQDVLNVMTFGPLRVTQAFMPYLRDGSKVINFTSQLAASTWPYGGLYPYVTAKAGLNRLMRSVAIDLKDKGIIVGIIHPGYVRTDMSGPDADISPSESAAGVKAVSEGWTLERSGEFLQWNGETHPW